MSAARKPKPEPSKISAELAARLEQTPPDAPFRLVVLLETPGVPTTTRRTSGAERAAIAKAVKDSAGMALGVVDDTLQALGGRRLSPAPDALGSISVEVPPAGVYQLARLKEVKAVLENQPIGPLLRPAR